MGSTPSCPPQIWFGSQSQPAFQLGGLPGSVCKVGSLPCLRGSAVLSTWPYDLTKTPPAPPHSPLGLPGNRAQGQEGEALPRDLGRVWGGKRLSWAKKEAEGLPAVRG